MQDSCSTYIRLLHVTFMRAERPMHWLLLLSSSWNYDMEWTPGSSITGVLFSGSTVI